MKVTWGEWSPCSKTCGGGTQERTFNITKEAQGNGSSCEASDGEKETRNCNEQTCLFLVLVILANMVIVSLITGHVVQGQKQGDMK